MMHIRHNLCPHLQTIHVLKEKTNLLLKQPSFHIVQIQELQSETLIMTQLKGLKRSVGIMCAFDSSNFLLPILNKMRNCRNWNIFNDNIIEVLATDNICIHFILSPELSLES